MPIGDLNHEIYKALVELVGEDYVEDEPAVMESFYRDPYSTVTVSVPAWNSWFYRVISLAYRVCLCPAQFPRRRSWPDPFMKGNYNDL